MSRFLLQVYFISLVILFAGNASAQGAIPIGAENVARLRPVARIDFANFPGKINIGWFEANHDASEFIVFDKAGRLYRIAPSGIESSWTFREHGQVFSLIDAAYLHDEAMILYLLDDMYFINDQRLETNQTPVALVASDDSLFVEANDGAGSIVYLEYVQKPELDALRLVNSVTLPETDPDVPAVRIGRIDFPLVLISSLADSGLAVYRYPDDFGSQKGRSFALDDGPAVFGAVNQPGSHLAWSDPHSSRLNLLDLTSGQNRKVAELGGAYAQYHLLTTEASAILIVNLNFAPEVFAWDVATGARHDLGKYRSCERIPDKVALSADGAALIIGCDAGLEIWRIPPESEE